MKVRSFDYYLPPEQIAQTPAQQRDESWLMVIDPLAKKSANKKFSSILDIIHPSDTLVFNDTRVFHARLLGIKQETGAKVELLILSLPEGNNQPVKALVGNAKTIKVGTVVEFAPSLNATATKIIGGGMIEFLFNIPNPIDMIEKYGELPLPPYIKTPLEDEERYQTIYSKELGSIAAPTAGLHFTNRIISQLLEKGVQICYLTLHVGFGTFAPIRSTNVGDHQMHEEVYTIPPRTAKFLNQALMGGRRIIAVGTTTLRALETNYRKNFGFYTPETSSTSIFIYPPQEVLSVNALVTNFHLPQSSLLMLVSSIAGRQFTLQTYRRAVKLNYRFFSLGDASFIYNNLVYHNQFTDNAYLLFQIAKDQQKGIKPKLLLHTCCAICLAACLPFLAAHYRITIFYDNSNIYPQKEYDLRLSEVKRLIDFFNYKNDQSIDIVTPEYDQSFALSCRSQPLVEDNNFRCLTCIKRRLEATFQYCVQHHYNYYATTLTASAYKPAEMINTIGYKIGMGRRWGKYLGSKYLPSNFHLDYPLPRGDIDYINTLRLYRQHYCGCQPERQKKEYLELALSTYKLDSDHDAKELSRLFNRLKRD